VTTSTSTIRAAGAARARGEPGDANYAGESELSKLIRYGCQFELEVHQMAELSQMRAENMKLRLNVQNGSADGQPTAH
jgi:hypothetical protein